MSKKQIINFGITASIWLILITWINFSSTIVELLLILIIAFVTSFIIESIEHSIKCNRQNIETLAKIDRSMADFDKMQYKKIGLKSN